MKKIAGATVAALLTTMVLAGCGGGSSNSAGTKVSTTPGSGSGSTSTTDSTTSGDGGGGLTSGNYCDDLKSAALALGSLGGSNEFTNDRFNALNSAVHSIADEAPSSIKGSWTLIAAQFDALRQALQEAGLSMDDFSKLSSGQVPSIDPAKLRVLETKLSSFDSKGVTAASTKISNEVQADCHLNLNQAGGGG
ncbi:MAG: hypothetical protein QOI51_1076 [Nocardioidaceae bacterium]|jgi:hypothetical protein|nr:hypothetical protein [Nocardioidaceae bacterium]MDX6309067.1 hypothetical protein [Nocardioidaceae bacterium]